MQYIIGAAYIMASGLDAVSETLYDAIVSLLYKAVKMNFDSMYLSINSNLGTATAQLSATPESFLGGGVYTMIHNLSDTVIVPIGGAILTMVVCYELISTVMDKNNLHDGDETFIFFRFLGKTCIGVYLLTHVFDIMTGLFEAGSSVVTSAAGVITATTTFNPGAQLDAMLDANFGPTVMFYVDSSSWADVGNLYALMCESMLIAFALKIVGLIIMVVVYARMVEIFIYMSISPMAFATVTNHEWGQIGLKYLRGIFALAFQAFLIMVCVGIYNALISGLTITGDIHTYMWSCGLSAVVLMIMMLKTGSISKSIFNAA